MSQIQQSVDVDVPVSVAYNQWTQFESFPDFMSGVESITQVDDTRNHWVTNIAGAARAAWVTGWGTASSPGSCRKAARPRRPGRT